MIENRLFEGPSVPLSQEIDKMKYRQDGETFHDKVLRLALSMSDDKEHEIELKEIYGEMRFLPAGRVQSAMGSKRITTAYNCFVSGEVEDSMKSIMKMAAQAAETMRKGGGIGYDFSAKSDHTEILLNHSNLKHLGQSPSWVSSMLFAKRLLPQADTEEALKWVSYGWIILIFSSFVNAKRNSDKLTGFNVSVGVTDEFMCAVGC